MSDTIKQWAYDAMYERIGAPLGMTSEVKLHTVLEALALMIQTHETEPVPWDLKRAREICDARWPGHGYLTDIHDQHDELLAVRTALNEPPRVTFNIKFSNGGDVIGVSLGDLLDYINKGIVQIEIVTLDNA